jgi:predicted nucleic acid-binding protein
MPDKKTFLDTNVIMYAYSNSEEAKQTVARKIIKENHTVISTQVLQELSNILRRKYNLDYPSVKATLLECSIDNNEVYTNTSQTIFKACDIAERYQFSFYDSLIIAAALASGCEILYSEDLQHNQIVETVLTIVNPFLLCRQHV